MEKGEVWLVSLSDSLGHEQVGTRPAIVVSDTNTSICIVIPVTSNLQAIRFGYGITIKPTASNGLKEDSVAMVFQLRAIDKFRLYKRLGRLEENTVKKVDEVLRALLKL